MVPKYVWLLRNYFLLAFALGFTSEVLAQVPVAKEPHHKVVFENGFIRIIDVWIKPGDTTLYHRHEINSAVVYLSKTVTGSQPLGGKPSSGQNNPGNSFFAAYNQNPIVHRVWNQDSVLFHVMDIELLKPARGLSCSMPVGADVQRTWEQPMAAVYRVQLKKGENLLMPAQPCPYLIVMIKGLGEFERKSEGTAAARHLKPGEYWWQDGGSVVQALADKEDQADFVLLVLR